LCRAIAAVPDHLLENELFGHTAGANTDARADQKGLVALAEGGTLFLDEVDSLSLSGQVKLLRFLQDGDYRPLGSADLRRANVRVLAATNVNLADAVAGRTFREDLFHRLNVLRVSAPPLRDRAADIPLLAQRFLDRFAREAGSRAVRFSAAAIELLACQRWPGRRL
jgi:two-component system, NtrC family, response regulator GlrR